MVDPPAISAEAAASLPRRVRWQRARRVLSLLAVAIVIGLIARAVGGADLLQSLRRLRHPAAGWLSLAVGAEAVSYLCYAAAQRRVAQAAGARLSLSWLASLAVAAQAVANFVPGGYVTGNVLNFRELRGRALTGPRCAWLLVMTSLIYMGALVGIAVIAIAVDRDGGTLVHGLRLGVLALVGVLVALSVGVAAGRRSARVRRCASGLTAVIERRGGPASRLVTAVREAGRQASAIRLCRRQAVIALALFGASWLGDAACLAFGLAAIGATPALPSILVAYAAAQVVAYLPITPGGLGLVEGSLTLVLATRGTAAGGILAGVLLYRGISYWATLPAGVAGYLNLRRGHGDAAGLTSAATLVGVAADPPAPALP